MNLTDIIQHLRSTTSRTNFDAWVSVNITELTDFFYTLSKEELLELKFDTDFYFGEFTRQYSKNLSKTEITANLLMRFYSYLQQLQKN